MNLRFAGPGDAQALLDIYAQYIPTTVTFEYDLPTREEFAGRIAEFSRQYPYLVCEDGDRIVGYAYAHRMLERAAYGWIAELSIYLDKSAAGRGVGGWMYGALMELLRLQNVKTVYGLVTLPNPPSQRLHERLGFALTGTLHASGYKNGAWRDVGYYEKHLSPAAVPPPAFIPIGELPMEEVERILGYAGACAAPDPAPKGPVPLESHHGE